MTTKTINQSSPQTRLHQCIKIKNQNYHNRAKGTFTVTVARQWAWVQATSTNPNKQPPSLLRKPLQASRVPPITPQAKSKEKKSATEDLEPSRSSKINNNSNCRATIFIIRIHLQRRGKPITNKSGAQEAKLWLLKYYTRDSIKTTREPKITWDTDCIILLLVRECELYYLH